ncbi:MAG TPA: NmrA/HSCARG family protein [Nitrospirota bacterium]|nr:NmrA/HSCARG family protein [Nitrospirota bacterium]
MEYRLKAEKIIFVTGATGTQGGAVAAELASAGWRVRALVRNPDKPTVRRLAWKGIELVKGDLNDQPSVREALRGVTGVFCNLAWREGGVDAEVKQGTMLINQSKAADIKHFIYSSVGGADRKTGIPHFESKWRIEEHLRASGLQWTIFRPVFLMTNFNAPEVQESIRRGSISMPLMSTRPLQLLAPGDLAVFVDKAFENPDTFAEKAYELAGDELTLPQIAAIFGKKIGRSVLYTEQSMDKVRSISREHAVMFEWFNKHGYQADIKALRLLHPGLMTFEEWLDRAREWAKAA